MRLGAILTRKRLARFGMALSLPVVAWLSVSSVVADRLTQRAAAIRPEPAPTVDWGSFESLRLTTSDGQELGAWYMDGEDREPSVILLHGNGGARGARLPHAEMFHRLGCATLLVTLRAHGDSTGEVNDFGYSARRDVVAAVQLMERRRPGRPILIAGSSLGAAAAIFAAPELSDRVAGYLLESPYADLRSAVWRRLDHRIWPGFSHVAYAGIRVVTPLVLRDAQRIRPVDAIVGMPQSATVIFLAGGRDWRAPRSDADALAEHCPASHQIVFFSDADHEDLLAADRALYERSVESLLGSVKSDATTQPADRGPVK